MNAHFFDIDTLIRVDNTVWIVSKINPKVPLLKITQSEFNLIKKGIYRKYNSPLKIGNFQYWIPENLLNQIKIKCKIHKCDINDIAFSMQEFMNPELISELNSEILIENFAHLKNSNDDIYVICSKNTKRNYEPVISKLEDSLHKLGIEIKNFYFISETFYNRDADDISHKKVRLLIQHIVGLKTSGDKFTDEEITQYDNLYFYDDEVNSIVLSKDANNVLLSILSNTTKEIKEKVRETLKKSDKHLITNQITHNKANPVKSTNLKIELSNIVKTFENFNYKY